MENINKNKHETLEGLFATGAVGVSSETPPTAAVAAVAMAVAAATSRPCAADSGVAGTSEDMTVTMAGDGGTTPRCRRDFPLAGAGAASQPCK